MRGGPLAQFLRPSCGGTFFCATHLEDKAACLASEPMCSDYYYEDRRPWWKRLLGMRE